MASVITLCQDRLADRHTDSRRQSDPIATDRGGGTIVAIAGTITSPLVPWNSCGAYMSATLGVATMAYLPFCFFNLINVLISFLYAILGLQIKHIEPELNREEPPAEASWRAIGGQRVQPTEYEAAVRQGR